MGGSHRLRTALGLLLEGFQADVVIFDPDTISDRASYADAHQYARGVEVVLVNGVISIQNGRHTGALAGKVLLKTEPATSARYSFDSALESRSTTIRPGFGPW